MYRPFGALSYCLKSNLRAELSAWIPALYDISRKASNLAASLDLKARSLQGQAAEALASLDMQVIETPPRYQLSLPTLLGCLETNLIGEGTSEEAQSEALLARADQLLAEARQHLGELG